MGDRAGAERLPDILSDEEMDGYFSDMFSLGRTIQEATEKICTNELKKSFGELMKYSHSFMQEYAIIQQILEKSFSDLTLKAREALRSTVDVAEARKSHSSGAPDELLKVAVASYRSDFCELISPLPRLREKCGVFLKELKDETEALRQQCRSRSRPPPTESSDDEDDRPLVIDATGGAVDSSQPETTGSPVKARLTSKKKKSF